MNIKTQALYKVSTLNINTDESIIINNSQIKQKSNIKKKNSTHKVDRYNIRQRKHEFNIDQSRLAATKASGSSFKVKLKNIANSPFEKEKVHTRSEVNLLSSSLFNKVALSSHKEKLENDDTYTASKIQLKMLQFQERA